MPAAITVARGRRLDPLILFCELQREIAFRPRPVGDEEHTYRRDPLTRPSRIVTTIKARAELEAPIAQGQAMRNRILSFRAARDFSSPYAVGTVAIREGLLTEVDEDILGSYHALQV